MNKETFGTRLKRLRKEKGLTTTALGKLIGVNHTTISRWENEEMEPSFNNIFSLTKVLNVSSDYLIGIEY